MWDAHGVIHNEESNKECENKCRSDCSVYKINIRW